MHSELIELVLNPAVFDRRSSLNSAAAAEKKGKERRGETWTLVRVGIITILLFNRRGCCRQRRQRFTFSSVCVGLPLPLFITSKGKRKNLLSYSAKNEMGWVPHHRRVTSGDDGHYSATSLFNAN